MKQPKKRKKLHLPESFRPILWGLDWKRLDAEKDREDVVVGTVNEGSIGQWRWIRKAYGDRAIRSILSHRLASEFHPESLNLARIVFGVNHVRHVRRRPHRKRA